MGQRNSLLNKGDQVEKVMYEIRPYAFATFGVAVLFNSAYHSKVMHGFCYVLIAASLVIILNRLRHRGVLD
jgi:hypothetical protein